MQAGDAGVVKKEVLNATLLLVKGDGHKVPVSKKGYFELVYILAERFRRRNTSRRLKLGSWLLMRWRSASWSRNCVFWRMIPLWCRI